MMHRATRSLLASSVHHDPFLHPSDIPVADMLGAPVEGDGGNYEDLSRTNAEGANITQSYGLYGSMASSLRGSLLGSSLGVDGDGEDAASLEGKMRETMPFSLMLLEKHSAQQQLQQSSSTVSTVKKTTTNDSKGHRYGHDADGDGDGGVGDEESPTAATPLMKKGVSFSVKEEEQDSGGAPGPETTATTIPSVQMRDHLSARNGKIVGLLAVFLIALACFMSDGEQLEARNLVAVSSGVPIISIPSLTLSLPCIFVNQCPLI